jgi:Tfp pilus assembly protein PilX
MKSRLQDNQGITLVVVLMVMVILLSVIGGGLLFSGINSKITANYQTGTKAFYAADTGINAALNQLAADPATATATLSANMGGGLAYRSGHRTDSTPQPLVFLRTQPQSGYSLGSGTGYNASGYTFYQYQMNVTGTYTSTYGTELAGREIEAVASYGPVPK